MPNSNYTESYKNIWYAKLGKEKMLFSKACKSDILSLLWPGKNPTQKKNQIKGNISTCDLDSQKQEYELFYYFLISCIIGYLYFNVNKTQNVSIF